MNKKDQQKIVTLSFIFAGGLVAFVAKVLLDSIASNLVFFARFYSQDLFQHGVPVLCGLLTFGLLQFNSKVCLWANEVLVEIKNIVWPSRKDTIAMTLVCCVMLIVAGVILGVFDFFASHLVRLILD